MTSVITGEHTQPALHILPNILIVDDRKENLLVTEKVLKNLPARLFTASSGNDAMLRNKFAAVILDVQMPEMDGFEVAGLRKIKQAGGLAIVQDPSTAESPFMPQSAISIAAPDHVTVLEGIAALLQKIAARQR